MFSKPPLNVLRTPKLPKHTNKAPQPLKDTMKGETIFATSGACSPSWAPFWHPQTSHKTIARLQKSFKAFFTEPLIGFQFFPWKSQHKCFPCGTSQVRALQPTGLTSIPHPYHQQRTFSLKKEVLSLWEAQIGICKMRGHARNARHVRGLFLLSADSFAAYCFLSFALKKNACANYYNFIYLFIYCKPSNKHLFLLTSFDFVCGSSSVTID